MMPATRGARLTQMCQFRERIRDDRASMFKPTRQFGIAFRILAINNDIDDVRSRSFTTLGSRY
jgi:hypothetical protein